MKEMMTTMLKLQVEANNQMAGPDWITNREKFDYASAIRDEVVEAAVSAGWKPWWSKADSQYNLSNLHLELVDIFHFHISLLMQESAAAVKSAHNHTETLLGHVAGFLATSAASAPAAGALNLYLGTTLCSGAAASTPLFFVVCAQYKLSVDMLYRYYIAKNALNVFRTEIGYKQNKNVKYWGPDKIEDNDYVMELARSNNINSWGEIMALIKVEHKRVHLDTVDVGLQS